MSERDRRIDGTADTPSTGAPRAVAGYRLLRKIGDGGMSAVYQSYDVSADRPVAVKILADHLAGAGVAAAADGAGVRVLDLVPARLELPHRQQDALEEVHRLEPGDDDSGGGKRCSGSPAGPMCDSGGS